jgi:hypothetical protein
MMNIHVVCAAAEFLTLAYDAFMQISIENPLLDLPP